MAGVKLPKLPDMVIPTLSEKEAEKLLAQPDKSSDEGFRDFALILTFLDTGVRLSELASLKIADIDYEQSYFKVMGKGSKERYVPFGRRVAKTLMAYQVKHRSQPVGAENFWLRRDGLPLTADRLKNYRDFL